MQKQRQKVVKSVKKWDLIGYIYDYVYRVVMLAVVILQLISMEPNSSEQLVILSSSHMNRAKPGNGVMLMRCSWNNLGNKKIMDTTKKVY
jgi:hypothetical protein